MATEVQPRPFRFTASEYSTIAETGLFAGRRCELVEGSIVEREQISPRRATARTLARTALDLAFPVGHVVRPGFPLVLDASVPEPDVAIVVGDLRTHVDAHPTTALLVVEVVDAGTLRWTRETKTRVYARAAIPELWILDPTTDRLEVHREPRTLPGREPGYASVQLLHAGDVVPPLGAPGAKIPVADLLP